MSAYVSSGKVILFDCLVSVIMAFYAENNNDIYYKWYFLRKRYFQNLSGATGARGPLL